MKWNENSMIDTARRRTAWVVATALAALLAGCGDGQKYRVGTTYPVKGKVTLPDGKPLPSAKVIFSGPATGSATTDADGAFAFTGDNPGLPEGDYKVFLQVTESKGNAKKAVLPFPGKYLDEDASDLKAKVTSAGPNDFDFKLTKGSSATEKSHGGPPASQGPAKARD